MPTKKSDDKLPKRGAKKAKGKGAKPKATEDADVAELEAADLSATDEDEDGDNVVELRPAKPKLTANDVRRQQMIPGTEPPCIPELDKTIALLSDAKDARQRALKDVRELDAKVLEQLEEHGIAEYLFQDGEFRHYVEDKNGKRKLKYKRERADEDQGRAEA